MTRLLMGRLPFHPRDYDKLLIATISRSSLREISAALWRTAQTQRAAPANGLPVEAGHLDSPAGAAPM
ncbi:hypothetical protein CB1_000538022 [Camelus ferus]|nr:hypothetical protein CB1_000538022 [Camelus ferus]